MQIKRQTQQLYTQLFKCFHIITTFVSQPIRYLLVFLCFQLGMVIYFLVTAKQSEAALLIFTIVSYVATTMINCLFPFVDPGIIPKAPLENIAHQIPINSTQLIQDRKRGIFKSKQYSFPMKSHSLCVKFCGYCSIFRPPRSMHCYSCGTCIQKLDHHCPWLGMCIGKGNYNLYLLYILFMQITTSLLCVQTIRYTVTENYHGNQANYVFNMILVIMCSISCLFVFTLVVIHFKLSKSNITTKQIFHQKWDIQSGNPFQKSLFLKNWLKLFKNAYQSKYYLQANIVGNNTTPNPKEGVAIIQKQDTSHIIQSK